MSNVLGTLPPVTKVAEMAHAAGAIVVMDGAQAVPHRPVDVQTLGADFFAFSGHKMCGPGVGVLWGRRELLEEMPPFLFGGDMILTVKQQESKWNELPHKLEAGTPPIAEVVGLGAAVDYLQSIGMEAIHEHEQRVTGYAMERLTEVPGLDVLGPGSGAAGGRGLVHDGVRAPSRCLRNPERRRHLCEGRASLRAAPPRSFLYSGERARQLLHLQRP